MSETAPTASAELTGLAYVLNQYPMPSLTFIRREISALESLGWDVSRISIRRSSGELVDREDRAEADRVRVVLDRSRPLQVVGAFARVALTRPRALSKAFGHAARLGRGSGLRVRLLQIAYLVEACVVAEWCRASGIRHVHAHFGTNAPSVALLAEVLGGAPFSFTVHGPEEFDRPELLHLGDKIAAASFVVAISSYGRSQLMRWCDPRHWSKLEVVRCGLAGEYLDADPIPVPTESRFVCVARLGEQKGHLVLVEAVALLKEEGLKPIITLVGEGPMRQAIVDAIRMHEVDDLFRLVGWLDGVEVRDEIARSRAFVLPSFAEGLPVAIMEALACGRPVVATSVAGTPELVDASCGWVTPPGSAEALANALREAMRAPSDQLAEMGRIGRQRTMEHHDVRREAEKLGALFVESIGRDEP